MTAWHWPYIHQLTDYDWTRDPQAVGDNAGPEPEPTDVRWMWHCKRCRSALAQGYDFCTDCIREFWDEAESYGGDNQETNDRVMAIRRRYVNGD